MMRSSWSSSGFQFVEAEKFAPFGLQLIPRIITAVVLRSAIPGPLAVFKEIAELPSGLGVHAELARRPVDIAQVLFSRHFRHPPGTALKQDLFPQLISTVSDIALFNLPFVNVVGGARPPRMR